MNLNTQSKKKSSCPSWEMKSNSLPNLQPSHESELATKIGMIQNSFKWYGLKLV